MKCNRSMACRLFGSLLIPVVICSARLQAEVVDFEDLSLSAESYWNGSDNSGQFTSGSISFTNAFTDWGGGYTSWEGWAYSNRTDADTVGLAGQFSAYTSGGAADGSANYALATAGYDPVTASAIPPILSVPEGTYVASMMVANNAYAYWGMQGQDGGANFITRPFEPGDWFVLTIAGVDEAANAIVGMDPVEVYLGDWRGGIESYIDDWTEIDLSSLRGASELLFSWDSSVRNEYGSVLPAYVAVDNITLMPVPEPSTVMMVVGCALVGFCWRLRRRVTKKVENIKGLVETAPSQ